jgi:hypothetical protein
MAGHLKSTEPALTEQRMLTRFYMALFVGQVGRSVSNGSLPTHSPKKVGQVLEQLASDLSGKRAAAHGAERIAQESTRTRSKQSLSGKR